MTPKEKAKELVEKIRGKIISFLSDSMKDENAKQCALIAVDEIMSNGLLENQPKFNMMRGDAPTPQQIDYWSKVKTEINNL